LENVERKRPLWRPRQKREGNTEINLKKNVMKIWTELMWLRDGLSWKMWKGRDHFGGLDRNGRVILELI
jgi:hypothetical protein